MSAVRELVLQSGGHCGLKRNTHPHLAEPQRHSKKLPNPKLTPLIY